MNNRFIAAATLLATTAMVASPAAHAEITVYTTQQSFAAAVGSSGVDAFENLSITGITASPITRTAGSFGYTAAAPTNFYGAGTNADRWLSTNTATDPIAFSNFTGGVSAFGGMFFGSNVGGQFQSGSVVLTATDASGTVSRTITNATTSSFLGFVSTGQLLSATLTAIQPTSGPLWSTANNLTLGTAAVAAVPEPASWAMMIGGFGIVGGSLRRKRKITTRVQFA